MQPIQTMQTRLTGSATGVFWAGIIAIMCPIVLVSLFMFAPISTALAISIAFCAFVMRSKMWPELGMFLSVLVLVSLITSALILIEEHSRRDIYTQRVIGPYYPIDALPWFNVSAAYFGTEKYVTSDKNMAALDLSGDVLIQTEFFERRSDANEVRCDLRCIALLTNPNVDSVTIKPDPDIWRTGPKAVMPGFQPDPITYSIRGSPRCQSKWDNMDLTPKSYESPEALHAAMYEAFLRNERCLLSRPFEKNMEYRHVVDPELEIVIYQTLPPGAVI